jgi:hypothetical protein
VQISRSDRSLFHLERATETKAIAQDLDPDLAAAAKPGILILDVALCDRQRPSVSFAV